MIRTDIAWSTPSTITVKGFDLRKDIHGTLSLGDIAFLDTTHDSRSNDLRQLLMIAGP